MKDWMPGNERGVIELGRKWIKMFSSEEQRTAYKWDAELCTNAGTKINAFLEDVDAFEKADTSSNRTAKNVTKKGAIAAMRTFASTSVRNNPFMDIAARESMGLRTPDTVPTVTGRPVAMPNTIAEPTAYPLQHRVRALNFETGGKGKPTGVHGVRFAYQVGGERPATGATILHGRFSRKPEIIVMHDETDRGKPVYYAACYENIKGEAGPWSLVTEAYIG